MKKTFEEWKAQVNLFVLKKCGLHADDLPDWNYRDAYEDGVSPSQAASRAIKAAKEG